MTGLAKVYLVSVGIADYPGRKMDLTLCDNDAKTATWLYTQNSDVTYCQLLNSEATGSRITSAMRQVFAKATANDIVVFFYSGHGYEGGLYVYDGELSYGEIQKAMASSKCNNKMIFADACYAGRLRSNNGTSTSSSSTMRNANVMLFLSSRSDEVSYEYSGMKNGLFTTYLIKGLRGKADSNHDRTISAKELFRFVHSGVIEASNEEQHPVMWGRFNDNMPVLQW
jgi:uncharacterized caspase-like protein